MTPKVKLATVDDIRTFIVAYIQILHEETPKTLDERSEIAGATKALQDILRRIGPPK